MAIAISNTLARVRELTISADVWLRATEAEIKVTLWAPVARDGL